MQLEHRFTVPASIDVAWEALNDVEGVGSCFPGATVTSVEGDQFSGTCKIKLGPISMQYSGSGTFVERDKDSHRAVIEARGKDRRGNGTASVKVTTVLTAESDDRTAVAVDTDLNITGKPAQFGRGVIQDVSDKLLGQFAECLENKIGAPEEPEPAAPAPETPAATAASARATGTSSGDGAAGGTGAASTPAPSQSADGAATGSSTGSSTGSGRSAGAGSGTRRDEPESALDLGATVLPVLARRYAPYALGGLAVLVILWRLLRRR